MIGHDHLLTANLHYQAKEPGLDTSMEEAGMEALGQMGRVQQVTILIWFKRSKNCNGFVTFLPQVEAIHSYNTMKDNLMEYLAKFANSKKVVREEDIKEFFDGMKKNKKMKSGGPPSSCK